MRLLLAISITLFEYENRFECARVECTFIVEKRKSNNRTSLEIHYMSQAEAVCMKINTFRLNQMKSN